MGNLNFFDNFDTVIFLHDKPCLSTLNRAAAISVELLSTFYDDVSF